MFSHEKIWEAIDLLAARHDLTASGLARKAGLDPTAFNKSKRHSTDGRQRWPSTESIHKILDATGSRIEDFMAFMQEPVRLSGLKDSAPSSSAAAIPLLGFAQAGAGGFFDDGGFPVGQGWDVVEFPVSPAQKAAVYALEVQGESMMPLYRDGDMLIVKPGAQIRRNDRVVVRTRDGEVMAKVLVRQAAKTIELMSLNPEHPGRILDMAEVDWMARIIWASQ
jgi:phage repressor protein C with HTH and peptisase S24 domain